MIREAAGRVLSINVHFGEEVLACAFRRNGYIDLLQVVTANVCHPYIPAHFRKVFYLLVCIVLFCTVVHHIRGCSSTSLLSGTKNQTHDHREFLPCVMGCE